MSGWRLGTGAGELDYAERNGEKLVLAEREKIPADADLKALVEKGARGGIRTAGIDSEAVAAFGLWLEKDMAAAMGWLAAGAPYQEFRYFSVALGQWLGQGENHTQLAALLERYPAAAELLLEGAAHLADKRGAEFRFAIAKSLADPDERMEFIARALDDVDFVKSHMAELAGYVKGGLEDRFLDLLADAGEKEVMREAMRKAGLSPGILSKFEASGSPPREIADQVLNEEPELVRPQETASSLAETAKALEQGVAESVKDGEIWRTRPRAFDLALPDFGDWCDEVKEGRMSADELLARTKAAWPAEEAVSAGLERDLRTLVFRGIYKMDPVAGLRWYRAGGGNVAGQLGTHVSNLQAEQIVALLKEVPDFAELVGEDFKTLSRGTFAAWEKDDPAGYWQAMEELGELGKGRGLLGEEEEQR